MGRESPESEAVCAGRQLPKNTVCCLGAALAGKTSSNAIENRQAVTICSHYMSEAGWLRSRMDGPIWFLPVKRANSQAVHVIQS